MQKSLHRLSLILSTMAVSVIGIASYAETRPTIIPEPQILVWKDSQSFLVNSATRIVVNANPDEADLFTAGQLRRKIWDTTGQLPWVIKSRPGVPTTNVIAIGDPARNRAVAAILKQWPEAKDRNAKSEGYILGISASGVVVRGFDKRGTFYGCQTLIQLFEHYGKKSISSLFCYDYPDMPWRGTMVRIRDSFDVEFTKELVSEVMARYKLNVIELHMSYGVLWPSHPELHWMGPQRSQTPTKFSDIKLVADYAKRHFMEVIPSGVSWSHSWEWQTAGGLNRDLLEGTESRGTLCWRNPKAQKLIHDLIDDQIRFFNPKYLHMGWDEVGAIGVCPLCRGTDPAELFSEALWNDRNYLKDRGIDMLMWADMLRQDQNGGRQWSLYRAVSTMPKDIIVGDWIYTGHHTDFPSLKLWNESGLRSLATPYGVYPPGAENIYSWGQAAKRHKILGLVAFNKYRCGKKMENFHGTHMGAEIGCFSFYAEWSWTADKPTYNPLPYDGLQMALREISPCSPSNLAASRSEGKVTLQWTNPKSAGFTGTWVCYRTDRFPTEPLDGKFVCDKAGKPGNKEFCVQAKAPSGGRLYYAAFAHDGVRHFSAPAKVVVR